MTEDEFKALALSLPETSEGKHDGLPTFLVRGRRFATLGWPEPGQIALVLALEDQDALLSVGAGALRLAPGGWGRRGHCRLDLAAAEEGFVHSVTVAAWRRAAPRGLAKAYPG